MRDMWNILGPLRDLKMESNKSDSCPTSGLLVHSNSFPLDNVNLVTNGTSIEQTIQ